MKKLRVCLIAPLPPPYGGISNWTQMIVGKAKQNNENVSLRIINIAPHGRAVYDLSKCKRIFFGTLSLYLQLVYLIKNLLTGTNVVHLTTSGNLATVRDIIFLIIAKLFRIPTIYHLHFGRLPEISVLNNWEWRLLSIAIREANTVVTIDNKTGHTIKEKYNSVNVVMLPNCINVRDVNELTKCDRVPNLVTYLGWVIPTKGIRELVVAWKKLQTNGWHMQIVGPYETSFKDELEDMCCCDNITFLGEKAHCEAMQLLASSEIFVLPSYTEGFPYVVLEAMALGKAIIATEVGAIPEMLANDSGILIPQKDVLRLENALKLVMADVQLRNKLGRNAKARAMAEYDLDQIFKRLTDLWRFA